MLDRRTVYLCPDLDRILEDVREVRPTIWLAVPRVWEKMYEGVMVQLSGLAPRKRRLVEWALAAGQSWHAALQEGESHRLGLRARLKTALAERLVTRKLRAALGLDRTQIAITGGAPGRSEVAEFFRGLGLWLQEVYGQTEGYGTTSLSLHTEFRPGSCGRPFPLVDVRIAEDGEILVRGDNVSPGYLDDDELTAETFCDGWLHSGDLGRLDDDGFLWVEGRKKDIIITSGGKNITPSKIEQAIATLPLVSAAVVIGEGRKYLSAIIYVDHNLLEDADPDDPEAAVRAVLDSHLDNVNASLSRPEQIKKYLVRFEDIEQDTELLTVTMKVKRHRIMGKFREDIDQLYAEE
jgi:long-chain acyl-CoA synthetase